jgi:hypothetical protein
VVEVRRRVFEAGAVKNEDSRGKNNDTQRIPAHQTG